MKLRDVEKVEAMTYRLTGMARRLDVSTDTKARLDNLDNVIAEVRTFAWAFDEARAEPPEIRNKMHEEAMARWVAFITAEQGS